jgi:hypothetical protein
MTLKFGRDRVCFKFTPIRSMEVVETDDDFFYWTLAPGLLDCLLVAVAAGNQ